jgi:hypothetical protein
MNIKNALENLAIAVVVFLVGAFVGHKVTKVTSESVVEILKPTIDKAINKETVTNSIYNAIDNNFEKIKKSDSLKIIIDQQPYNDNKPTTTVKKEDCNCAVSQEEYNSLNSNRQRRINRWLNK